MLKLVFLLPEAESDKIFLDFIANAPRGIIRRGAYMSLAFPIFLFAEEGKHFSWMG
jgi:hypothetical protein